MFLQSSEGKGVRGVQTDESPCITTGLFSTLNSAPGFQAEFFVHSGHGCVFIGKQVFFLWGGWGVVSCWGAVRAQFARDMQRTGRHSQTLLLPISERKGVPDV